MADLVSPPLEYALLGFQMQGPLHGYDLHRRVRAELGRMWRVGISHTYASLKRLEQTGLLESSYQAHGNRPPRKVYRITPAGRARFLEWVSQPVPSMRDMRVEFPAKLYFMRCLALPGVRDLLAAQEDVCRLQLERLQQAAARTVVHDIDRLVFEFRCGQIQAALAWLQTCREQWAVSL